MYTEQIFVFFVFIASLHHVLSKPHDLGVKTDESAVQYYCSKFKYCTAGKAKVCGFDEYIPWLAEFEDLCTMYKANCKRAGLFIQVDQEVCDMRIQYDREHGNETFEYIHIMTTTTPTRRPRTTQNYSDYSLMRFGKVQLVKKD